jgi:hypothetical protein
MVTSSVVRHGRGLTEVSDYPTVRVMTADIDWGRLFGRSVASAPPPAAPSAAASSDPTAELARLRALTPAAMERHVAALLDALRQRAGSADALELAEDGSVRVNSMVAVGLLSEIASSVGLPRLTVLSREPHGDLGSVKGLARLVRRCLVQAVAS